MTRLALALTFALLATAASAQTGTPVKQSGAITPGHVPMWVTNGVIQDGGTAANGFLSSLGVTALGPGICQNSGPVTGGAYNQVCLNVTAAGGGFSLNNYNGATGGFTLTLNGVTQSLVTINLPTILNNPVCFSNTTGTMQDCTVTGSGSAVLATAPTISALTVTGSFTATGLVTNADLVNTTIVANGTTCTLGGSCTITTAAASITIGTTTVAGGTSGTILYQNGASPAGTVGELTTTGSGTVVALATGPTFVGATVTTSFTATGLVTLADLATQGANTVLVNATSGSASPTAQSVVTCSTAASALIWVTNSGFACNTAITAAAAPATGLTGQVAVANGGTGLATLTSNVIYKGNGTGNIATSALTDNGTIVSSSESIDVQTNAFIIEVANSGTGTTINLIAVLAGAPSQVQTAITATTNGAVGIVVGGAGTTGNAQIAHAGQASCVFDGATTAGDYITISGSVAGNCHDAGATYPTSGQIIGRVLSTNASGGTFVVLVFPSEIDGAAGGGGGYTSSQILAGSAITISGTCNSTSSISCTIINNGVTSVNSIAGGVTIAAGNGAAVANAGSTITLSAVLANYLGGLVLSNDVSSPTTVIDIASGMASDSTNAANISIGAFTKSTGGAWSSGSGSTGMGNGLTIANNTWYHVCLANNAGTADVWFDTSATCANRPSGISDTKYRRIGSFKTASAATTILAFVQNSNEFLWITPISEKNAVSVPTSDTLFALAGVPTGIKVNAEIRGYGTGSGIYGLIHAADEGAQTIFSPAGNANVLGLTSGAIVFNMAVRTNTSAQLRWVAQSGLTATFVTNGWIDTRGQ